MYTLIKSVMKKSQISPISLSDLLCFYRQIRCREPTTTEANEPVRCFAQKQKERERTRTGSSVERFYRKERSSKCIGSCYWVFKVQTQTPPLYRDE